MSNDTSEKNDKAWLIDGDPKWPYDKYVKTYILKPLQLDFVQATYDIAIKDLSDWAREQLVPAFSKVEQAGVRSLFEFIDLVSTQERAERFIDQAGMAVDRLIDLVEYVRRWVIPGRTQLRPLFDESDQVLAGHFFTLKQHKLANTFALLERARTRAGRKTLAEQTGVPEAVILDFVHRADVARLPFLGGRMIKLLWTIGYKSMEQLRQADPEQLFAQFTEYYSIHGKGKPFDLNARGSQGLIRNARRLPAVVEE